MHLLRNLWLAYYQSSEVSVRTMLFRHVGCASILVALWEGSLGYFAEYHCRCVDCGCLLRQYDCSWHIEKTLVSENVISRSLPTCRDVVPVRDRSQLSTQASFVPCIRIRFHFWYTSRMRAALGHISPERTVRKIRLKVLRSANVIEMDRWKQERRLKIQITKATYNHQRQKMINKCVTEHTRATRTLIDNRETLRSKAMKTKRSFSSCVPP